MAINIDFDADQTERLVAAFEALAYSHTFQTGYMQHAKDLYNRENKSSYALNAGFSEPTIDKLFEVVKNLLKNPEYRALTDELIGKELSYDFDKGHEKI